MSHMVIYRGADGKPGYHQTDEIHDAVHFVEQMRNHDGVEHARIFRLEEVVFQYRPYYRVELAESLGLAEDQGPPPAPDPAANGRPADRNVVLPPLGQDEASDYGLGDVDRVRNGTNPQGPPSALDGEPDEAGVVTEKKGLFGR